ncbi:MAG: hypothetical protein U5L11_00885 [Arhodomonas sp.]|nr:hypothetical protein [Arhodomonas sp.]
MKRDLIEGFHYTRAFHGRKYLLIWERVEQELLSEVAEGEAESGGLQIPMAKEDAAMSTHPSPSRPESSSSTSATRGSAAGSTPG